ncbi:toxin-antitoxin system HicB family antitoxin [Devosia sp.]|uniref:toxin-antitoxin system HicB family antitoxin n=1 Tax=Devosia sp. TaxID=1871048 RepID=UPI0035259F80
MTRRLPKKLNPAVCYSGNIALRVDPGIHRKASILAGASGMSISKWIEHQIERA